MASPNTNSRRGCREDCVDGRSKNAAEPQARPQDLRVDVAMMMTLTPAEGIAHGAIQLGETKEVASGHRWRGTWKRAMLSRSVEEEGAVRSSPVSPPTPQPISEELHNREHLIAV